MTVTIWHNPACGTSRNTLAMIRASGEEPVVIEYLKEPPSRARLKELIAAMGITPRDLLREKGTPYAELGLNDPSLTDDQLLDAMRQDKKVRDGALTFILARGIGQSFIAPGVDRAEVMAFLRDELATDADA